jgi:hypothetical protein
LNHSPTEAEVRHWHTIGYSWSELKYKDFKSVGGIFAYDVFCGVFDGLAKVSREYALNSVEDQSSRAVGSERGRWNRETNSRQESVSEKELSELIWEPLLVDMMNLLQVAPFFLSLLIEDPPSCCRNAVRWLGLVGHISSRWRQRNRPPFSSAKKN